jgi:hypothetical protein
MKTFCTLHIRSAPIWIGFGLASALSWAAYYWPSALHSYTLILILLMIINVFLGCWIVYLEDLAPRAIVAVVVGLLVGQWWIVVWSIVFLIWWVRGFAP